MFEKLIGCAKDVIVYRF